MMNIPVLSTGNVSAFIRHLYAVCMCILIKFGCYRSSKPSKLLSTVREKGEMFRERLLLVKQRLLRNENFCPPSMTMSDNPDFIRVSEESF